MDKRLKEIAAFYDTEMQMCQLIEEMAELTAAINKFQRASLGYYVSDCEPEEETKQIIKDQQCFVTQARKNIESEIVDVEICLKQVKFLMGVDKQRMKQIREKKIERQLERIRQEKGINHW